MKANAPPPVPMFNSIAGGTVYVNATYGNCNHSNYTYCEIVKPSITYYTAGMSYEVGTYIDLSYLNTKPVVKSEPMFHAAVERLVEPGTQIVFVKTLEPAAA